MPERAFDLLGRDWKRLCGAIEQDPHAFDDVPKWVKPMIFPMHAEVAAVMIEYSLHDGRFWLPRARTAEGSATVSFMRMPFSLEQSFRYNAVNAAGAPHLPTMNTSCAVMLRVKPSL